MKPVIYIISFAWGKKDKIKIVSSFSVVNLRFVINVLNNKTIILLKLAEYPLIFASGDIARHFAG